jgi:hypothetical protein
MSNGPKTRNIVDIAPDMLGRVAGRVLPQLRAIAGKRLSALSAGLFDGVDDALFDMAERSGTNAVQARYFDGMREIRRKRQRGDVAWQEAFARQLTEFEAGKLAPNSDEAGAGKRADETGTLALVGEAELEETLALNAMIDKAEVRLMRPLYALNQRFGLLAGGRKVDSSNNPIGPRLLCQAFTHALAEFDVDLQVKLIVLKLFERFVLANLDALYEESNALLVQAGVMPELRYSIASARRPESGRAAPPSAMDNTPETEAFEAAESYGGGTRTDNEILGLVNELRGLIAARRRPAGMGNAPGYSGAPMRGGAAADAATSAQELLNALTLMQTEMQAQQFAATHVPAPAQIKHDLLAQVRRLGGGGHAPHFGADEDTIDLVGMLFEYALQDRNLPAPIQALLGRLQIPYLKVALMDREFIAHKSHPARRLLDDLAQACVGWSEDSDKDRRLYEKVHDIVVRLLKEFDDDIGIFERLNAEFQDFADKNRRRAEIAERRTTEAAQGRERLEQAQRSAARAILTRIQGANLPDSVRDLLTRRWSNYLVLTFLRHGEESAEWRNAVRFIEDLAWSVQPLRSDSDRVRLRELTPEIEQLLRRGLAATGLHEGFLDEVWREVQKIYAHQFDPRLPEPQRSAPVPTAEELSIRFASSRAGEEVVFQSDQESETADPDVDRAAAEALDTWLKIARALKTGTWFEFIKDDGSRERAKLLWISTIRALYLFVNRNGLKIAEKTASELADELKSQRAVILEQVALVDRALDAILNRLRDTGGAAGDGSDAGATPPGSEATSPAPTGVTADTRPVTAPAGAAAVAPSQAAPTPAKPTPPKPR